MHHAARLVHASELMLSCIGFVQFAHVELASLLLRHGYSQVDFPPHCPSIHCADGNEHRKRYFTVISRYRAERWKVQITNVYKFLSQQLCREHSSGFIRSNGLRQNLAEIMQLGWKH